MFSWVVRASLGERFIIKKQCPVKFYYPEKTLFQFTFDFLCIQFIRKWIIFLFSSFTIPKRKKIETNDAIVCKQFLSWISKKFFSIWIPLQCFLLFLYRWFIFHTVFENITCSALLPAFAQFPWNENNIYFRWLN